MSKIKVSAGLVLPDASLLCVQTVSVSSMCPHRFPNVCLNLLEGHQSDWIRAHT